VGYNSNPDAEVSTGQAAISEIMTLPGACSSNIWRSIRSSAILEDKNKWYNVDGDSREIMQTTQGYYALALQSPPSTTGPLVMPVMLDYTIQFKGSAINRGPSANLFIFPAGSFGYDSITGNFTFTADSGEPAVPSTNNFDLYSIIPHYQIAVDSSAGDEVEYINIGAVVPTTASWSFFGTPEDASVGTQLQIHQTFRVLRSTWTLTLN